VTLRHNGTVYAVAFRPPDGRVVVTGSGDRTVRFWDASTGAPVGGPIDHPARVLALAFSPDGRVLATGCGDGLARLWDAVTGDPIGSPVRHRGPVRSIAFAPDAGLLTLLSGSEDRTARMEEVPGPLSGATEQIIASLELASGMNLHDGDSFQSLPPDRWTALRRQLTPALDGQADHPEASPHALGTR
jgi:WD40 repeat protein